jgi:cytochrome bd-type quinol oxidase subunit 1
MEFLHASIALLASMVLILAGMVAWLYWQQTRLFQNMNTMVMVIGELTRPQPPTISLAEYVPEEPKETPPTPTATEAVEEDDRASVHEEAEVVAGPPAVDTDGLEDKSIKELKDLLTKRGIPYGKRDNKNTLITLLKATA